MEWWHELAQPAALGALKAAVATAVCLALVFLPTGHWWRGKAGQVAIGAAAALALLAYFQLLTFPGGAYLHRWEMYHYYVGSKYSAELGYEGLYECSTVADVEAGIDVRRRLIRNLADDTLLSANAVRERGDDCRARFTPDRWERFTADIAAFRRLAGSRVQWERMLLDHGYNPSPVWTLVGRQVAARVPPTRAGLSYLALVDVAFITLSLLALAWAFGGRTAALAAIFLGTQAPAGMEWTGGAFLRFDWWLLTVLSVALLRRGRPFLAGGALAWAGLLRVFPLLLWAGPVVLAIAALVRRRAIPVPLRRMFAGGATALILLTVAATLDSGPQGFVDFGRHITMHAGTPIQNHMSLRTLFASVGAESNIAAPGAVPVGELDAWTRSRLERTRERRPWFVLTSVALLALFGATTWRLRTPWIAVVLSLLPVVVLTDPSCYYFSIFLLAVVLGRARRSLEAAALGVAAAGQYLALQTVSADARYLALAALYVAFATIAVVMFARPPARRFARGPCQSSPQTGEAT